MSTTGMCLAGMHLVCHRAQAHCDCKCHPAQRQADRQTALDRNKAKELKRIGDAYRRALARKKAK